MLRRFEEHLTDQDWHQVREDIAVKLVPSPDGEETFILARSTDRREKERAMHDRFTEKSEAGLKRMATSAQRGRLRDEGVARQRLGRLLERYWRASHAFEVTIRRLESPRDKQHLEISWQRNAKWHDWGQLADGCYLLRSNLVGVDAEVLWRRYVQLTEAEWAFRITKDELSIRPIWHHKEDRVKSHILVCFLAYAMWKTVSGWMRRSDLGDAPCSLLEEFAKIKSGDVVLHARRRTDEREHALRLRCVSEPDAAQSASRPAGADAPPPSPYRRRPYTNVVE